MPVWFLGVLLCYVPKFLPFEKRIGLVVLFFMASIPIYIVEFGIDLTVQNWISSHFPYVWRLGPSTKFLTDYFIGLSFFVSFWVLGSRNFNVSPIFVRWGVFLAGFSFTLYLFHDPILRMLKFMSHGYTFSAYEHFMVIVGTVILCWLISLVTENKTPQVRRYIEQVQGQRLRNS
jgi:peptidoglycan/LPS O-acetylase OafA/YrhL